MHLYIIVEPAFKTTSSCNIIFKGLKSILRKKRISHLTVSSVSEITEFDHAYLIIISNNMSFIHNLVAECDRAKVHPVILTPQLLHSLPGVYSDVTSDVRHSIRYLMSFLKKSKVTSPALYGISENSFPDMARRDRFLEKHILPTSEDAVFYNRTGLDDCFKNFFEHIKKYDCIICPNDYVAIHLIKKLKENGLSTDNFKLISYGQLLISAKYHPEIISISVGYEDFGKAAITICEELENNPELLYMSLSTKSKISGYESYSPEMLSPENSVFDVDGDDIFYKDPHIQNMILIEKLLTSSDKTDLLILDMVINGASYEDIANACFLSLSATKYRVRRMVQNCNCASKSEFIEMVQKYV